MAEKTRKTLVLTGVSVLRDGRNVVVRLGTGYPAETQPPAAISPRHGFGPNPEPQRRCGNDDPVVDDRTTLRAGRSDSRAGVLSLSAPMHGMGRAASPRGARVDGGSRPTAAACAGALRPWSVAPVGKSARDGRTCGNFSWQASVSAEHPARIPPTGGHGS